MTQIAAAGKTPGDTLSLRFEGGLAESGALLLDEYAASLDGWREILTASPQADRAQALAEKLDSSLKRATQPLERSCERLKVLLPDRTTLFEIGPAERAVIVAPLTLPPPKREWREARIKFERINRKTGRALFYFDGEDSGHAAHYSRIIDPAVRQPHNRYTQAFNDDEALDVWLRQTHPEPGRLNFQWEITAKDPNGETLFELPPPSDEGK
jgi:hypothetical protein